MAIAKPYDKNVINPRVGDSSNNLQNSPTSTGTIESTTVVTETKVVDTELVNNINPWRDTQAVRDAETLTIVPGRAWIVEYYKGIRGNDDVGDVSDSLTTGVSQQFAKYSDLTLKVQAALTPSTDPTTQVTSIVGTSIVESILVPSVGDHIVAKLEAGRRAVMVVTSAMPMSIFKGRAYTIEYSVIDLPTETILELDSKVIQTYHCRSIGRSDNVVALTSGKLMATYDLAQSISRITESWAIEFYNDRAFTYCVDFNDRLHHDPLTVEFYRALTGTTDYVERYVDTTQIRGAIYLILLSGTLPNKASRDIATIVNLSGTGLRPHLSRVAYVGIESVPNLDDSIGVNVLLRSVVEQPTVSKMKDGWVGSDLVTLNTLPNPTLHDNYLFKDGWLNEPEMSVLESQIKAHLTGRLTDETLILQLIINLENEASLHERYFYGPIILFLAKVHYAKYGFN